MAVDLRDWVRNLCLDYASGRLDVVLSNVDDQVEFVIYAPPDIVPSHSRKRGKAALAATLLKVQADFEYLSYRPHVIGGDAQTAAVIILARLRHRTSGRVNDLFITNFLRLRDWRIVEMREFVERADTVERMFGRAAPHATRPATNVSPSTPPG
jgi:ketosteroid isomerase-like protein